MLAALAAQEAEVLGVRSRYLVDQTEPEAHGLDCPDLADGHVRREDFGPRPKVEAGDEIVEVLPQLVPTVMVIAFDGHIRDDAVHPRFLTARPGMIDLGEAVLAAFSRGQPELVPVIRQDGGSLLGHGRNRSNQEG